MQRLLLIILTSIFLITSCRKSTPEGILPEQTMVELMSEVHLVDGYLSTLSIDSSRKIINSLYGHIFDKYQLDSAGFQKNVDYYLGNPTLSKKLYGTINQSMTQRDAEFRRADSTIQAIRNDSIQRIQYYTKLASEQRSLILEAKLDTVPLSFDKYHREFIARVGINVRADNGRTNNSKPNAKNVQSGSVSATPIRNPSAGPDKKKEPAEHAAEATTDN